VRRRLVLATGAALVAAAALQLGAGPAEPLPTLHNAADWAGSGPDAAWLDRGTVPGAGVHRGLVARALLDLRALTRPNGAVAAGPSGPWAYAWPRDNAFVAVAYAVSGHPDDAWRTLQFFVGTQRDDGDFEARYRLDGSGVPDNRPRQTDGAGWLLWAIDTVRRETGQSVPADLRTLRDRAVARVVALTAGGRRLPPASPDYWEVPERRVTLATVAPLAAGLEAAARTHAAEGDAERSAAIAAAAARLRGVTSWGSLPEKVLPDGRPAGPAPLAWTAALFVLIEAELAAL